MSEPASESSAQRPAPARKLATEPDDTAPRRTDRAQRGRAESALETITRYYDGCCASGDVDAMLDTLDPDVVHYFLAPNVGSAPCAARSTWRGTGARSRA